MPQMFTPILHHHCPVVSTIRAAPQSRSLVRYQRYRYHRCQYSRIWSCESPSSPLEVSDNQGHINSDNFKAWQALYLVAGIITIASAPLVWFFLDSDIETCRFLTETEKKMAYERLRANQTGTGTREWKWDQVIEVFVDPKSYIWLGIVMLPNIGAAVTNVFGPTLIKGFGYDKFV